FEISKRTCRFVTGFLLQPLPRLGALRSGQESPNEDAVNLFFAGGRIRQPFRRPPAKFGQRFIPGGGRPIFGRADGFTSKTKMFRKERAVPKPDAAIAGK